MTRPELDYARRLREILDEQDVPADQAEPEKLDEQGLLL